MSSRDEQAGGRLETRDDSRQAARHLAENVRRELCLFTRDLEPALFDQADFLEAVRQFVIRSRHTRIRLLLQDATRAIREGHGLVRLGMRLPTHISLHRVHEDDAGHADSFIVADEHGYLYRPLADRLEGRWQAHEPAEARRLKKRFDEMWERSQPENEFRRIGV